LACEGDNVVHLWADANPLANTVVMVARHMGHDGLAALQFQGVKKFIAPKSLAQNSRLYFGCIVMHYVVGPQQNVAGAKA
jgi:hypothetical protein